MANLESEVVDQLLEALETLVAVTRRMNPRMDEHSELARIVRDAERVAHQARAGNDRDHIRSR